MQKPTRIEAHTSRTFGSLGVVEFGSRGPVKRGVGSARATSRVSRLNAHMPTKRAVQTVWLLLIVGGTSLWLRVLAMA